MATDERELIRSICPNEGNTIIEDDPNILFFRLAPEVSPCVRTFLESRGWVDLSYLQLHPTDPCRLPPKAMLVNKEKSNNLRKTMALLLKAKKGLEVSTSAPTLSTTDAAIVSALDSSSPSSPLTLPTSTSHCASNRTEPDTRPLAFYRAQVPTAPANTTTTTSAVLESNRLGTMTGGEVSEARGGVDVGAVGVGGVSENMEKKPVSRFAFGARDADKPKRDLEYYKQVSGIWNLWWEDSGFLPLLYSMMNSGQSLNHLPTLSTVYRKDNLALAMHTLGKKYGSGIFGITPETYLLPVQFPKFKDAFLDSYQQAKQNYFSRNDSSENPLRQDSQNSTVLSGVTAGVTDAEDGGVPLPVNERPVWIAKPVAGARGQGIFLFRTLRELNTKWAKAHGKAPFVIQRYMSNPLLVGELDRDGSSGSGSGSSGSSGGGDGGAVQACVADVDSIITSSPTSTSTSTSTSPPRRYKFDLRLYALVESNWPLRLHLHRRGIVRFSSQPYSDDISDTLAHLTNFSLNKDKDKEEKGEREKGSKDEREREEKGEEKGEVRNNGKYEDTSDKEEKVADRDVDNIDGNTNPENYLQNPNSGISEISRTSIRNRVSSKGIDYNNPTQGPSGCKWELTDLFEYLSKETTIDSQQLWLNIQHAIIKALLPVVSASVTNTIDYSQGYDLGKNPQSGNPASEIPDSYQCPNLHSSSCISPSLLSHPVLPCTCRHEDLPSLVSCINPHYAGYELIGVDVMIDDHGDVYIVELNRSPAMMVSTDVDRYVKTKVLHDVFNLLKIEPTLLAAKRMSKKNQNLKNKEGKQDMGGQEGKPIMRDSIRTTTGPSGKTEIGKNDGIPEQKFKPTVAWQYYHSSRPVDMKSVPNTNALLSPISDVSTTHLSSLSDPMSNLASSDSTPVSPTANSISNVSSSVSNMSKLPNNTYNRYLARCNGMKPSAGLMAKTQMYGTSHEFEPLFPLNIYNYVDLTTIMEEMNRNSEFMGKFVCPNQVSPDVVLDFLEKIADSGENISRFIPNLGKLRDISQNDDNKNCNPTELTLNGKGTVTLLRQLWQQIHECNLATQAAYAAAVEMELNKGTKTSKQAALVSKLPPASPHYVASERYTASFRARVDAVKTLPPVMSADAGGRSLVASLIPSLPLAMQVKYQHEKSVYLDAICRYFIWWEEHVEKKRVYGGSDQEKR